METESAMAQDQTKSTLVAALTKPRGALLAAPLLLAAALGVSALAGGPPAPVVAASPPGADSAKIKSSASIAAEASKKAIGTTPVEPKSARFLANEAAATATVELASSKSASGFSADQRNEIGEIVREYLLANPEVLVEISQKLEVKRREQETANQQKVLLSEQASIFRSPHDYVAGNPKGDVTVVEFFDYNCGWCKRALNEVNKLTAQDKNVRVVMKEFPIFGEHSAFAAKAALASIKQGKYWEFHNALMKEERVTTSNTMDIAKTVGLDVEALKREMQDAKYDRIIAENTRVAQALGMQGTPGFIIDSKINFGYVPADNIIGTLAEVRRDGCKVC